MQSIHTTTWIKLLLFTACLSACSNLSPAATPPTERDPASPAAPNLSLTAIPATSAPLSPGDLTPTLPPTPDLVATAQAGSPAQIISSQVSPDGLWWARVFSHPCPPGAIGGSYGYDTLQLTDQTSGEHQILVDQLITCGGLGAYGLKGLFWAHTSRYYYFTNAASGVPDGCGYWRPPMLRIDLADWNITYLGAGVISPDGFKFAAWLNDELVIWDLNGKQIGGAPPPVDNAYAGPIAWAPDGQSIAFLLSEGNCPPGLTYIVRMRLSDFQPALFFASQDPSFVDIRWDMPNRVILSDESGANWAYNFITGGLARYQTP